MAAIDEAERPRKRITTYGKSTTKYVREYVGSGGQQPSIPNAEENNAVAQNPRMFLSIPSIARSRRSSPARSAPSSSSDVFDVPDDDEDRPGTPSKRRKMVHRNLSNEDKAMKNKRNRSHSPRGSLIELGVNNKDSKSNAPSSTAFLQNRPKPTSLPSVRQPKTKTESPSAALENPLKVTGISKSHGSSLSLSRNHILGWNSQPGDRHGTPPRHSDATAPATSSPDGPRPRHQLATTPRKLRSLTPEKGLSAPSTPPDQLNVEQPPSAQSTPAVLTPKVMKMWNGLLGDDDNEVGEGLRTDSLGKSCAEIFKQKISSPKGQTHRTRLIDSLVQQSKDSRLSPSSSNESDDEDEVESSPREEPLREQMQEEEDRNLAVESTKASVSVDSVALLAVVGSGGGPKLTYGTRQRSMLAEKDILDAITFDDDQELEVSSDRRRNRRGSFPALAPLQGLRENEENEDGHHGGAIRTVHELRQAGANKRFLNEIEDILERIDVPGKDSSTRRSGLLELAEKMYDKEFSRQFLSNGMDQRLFIHLGQESDIISGFLIISLLIVVLGAGLTPAAITQLRRQGITRLLIRVISVKESLTVFARDRKNNMSRLAQTMLSENCSRMMQLRVWEEIQAEHISPRTNALRCLELMVRQSREAGNAGEILSKELTTNLFGILKVHSDSWLWKQLQEPNAVDFRLALSTLESHSLRAMTGSDSSHWIEEYLPVVKCLLENALGDPHGDSDYSKLLLLRLVINVTNNNSNASDVFATPLVLGVMSRAIVYKFELLSKFLTEEQRLSIVDHLILMLGVMINFAEWSIPARECFESLQYGHDEPLDDMVKVFLENLEKTSEADSVEDTHRNVAFGYLAVLLGFACLSSAVAMRVRLRQPDKTLQRLVEAIEEFISHHKKVDDLFEDDGDGHNARVGLTERLQQMVDSLKRNYKIS